MTPHPDWQEILRAAHNAPLDPAHYTAVRARVLAEIERTRNPWRRLAWLSAAAGAIAACLLLALALRRPALPPLPPPGAAGDLVAGALPLAQAVRPVARRSAAPPKPPRQPLTIKFQTADPNIVIYWIAD